MPSTQILRRLRANVFQIFIDRTEPVAVLAGNALYIFADEVRLLASDLTGTPAEIARRVAEGEFDNDFRFEYSLNPEPSCNADRFFITQIATPSQIVIDSWTTEDPGAAIEAAREAQLYTLEERFDRYAEMGL